MGLLNLYQANDNCFLFFKQKNNVGWWNFWQTHLLVPVAEIIENPKRANYSVEVRILPQQQVPQQVVELISCRMVKFWQTHLLVAVAEKLGNFQQWK